MREETVLALSETTPCRRRPYCAICDLLANAVEAHRAPAAAPYDRDVTNTSLHCPMAHTGWSCAGGPSGAPVSPRGVGHARAAPVPEPPPIEAPPEPPSAIVVPPAPSAPSRRPSCERPRVSTNRPGVGPPVPPSPAEPPFAFDVVTDPPAPASTSAARIASRGQLVEIVGGTTACGEAASPSHRCRRNEPSA